MIRYNQLSFIEIVLNRYRDLDLNIQFHNGITCLMASIHNKYITKLLLDYPNIDVNIQDNNGEHILFYIFNEEGVEFNR